MNRCFAISIVIVAIFFSTVDASAADRSKMRAFNVGLQPLFATFSAAIQGKLNGPADYLRCVRGGLISGYGFYKAKQVTGDGHVRAGLVLGNVAASLSRNVAAGRNELSRLGASFGPFRFDVSTPFETNQYARFHVQGSIAEVGAMALMAHRSTKLAIRDGKISFHNSRTYNADGRRFTGYTIGMFSGTTYGATATTWHHESIHGIQAIQGDSIEPPECAWLRHSCDDPIAHHGVAWEHFQLGLIPIIGSGALSLQDYTRRWTEIEATWLAEKHAPR